MVYLVFEEEVLSLVDMFSFRFFLGGVVWIFGKIMSLLHRFVFGFNLGLVALLLPVSEGFGKPAGSCRQFTLSTVGRNQR